MAGMRKVAPYIWREEQNAWDHESILHYVLETMACKAVLHFAPTIQTTKCMPILHYALGSAHKHGLRTTFSGS
jgi:hypothetical protein